MEPIDIQSADYIFDHKRLNLNQAMAVWKHKYITFEKFKEYTIDYFPEVIKYSLLRYASENWSSTIPVALEDIKNFR